MYKMLCFVKIVLQRFTSCCFVVVIVYIKNKTFSLRGYVVGTFITYVKNIFFFILLTDIDECANSPCNQWCLNTVGSYICHCHIGYEVQGQNTCVGKRSLYLALESYICV